MSEAVDPFECDEADLELARKSLKRAIKIDPRNHSAMGNLADVVFNLGEFQLALDYYEFARVNDLVDVKAAQFMRWFNLMGIQRHLKAIGIFSRLKLRDGKSGYLKDIPRTLEYLRQVSADETSLVGLFTMIEQLGLKLRMSALLSS